MNGRYYEGQNNGREEVNTGRIDGFAPRMVKMVLLSGASQEEAAKVCQQTFINLGRTPEFWAQFVRECASSVK